MRVFLFEIFEYLYQQNPQPDRNDEEGEHPQNRNDGKPVRVDEREHGRGIGRSAVQTERDGQHDEPEHVVDNGRRHHDGADLGFELAQLAERFHRDAHAGRRHDDAHEQTAQQVFRSEKGHRNRETEPEGQYHAAERDEKGHEPRVLDLFKIRFQPRGEHDEHHADFGKHLERCVFLQGKNPVRLYVDEKPPDGGADQKSREDKAEHLRQSDPAHEHAQHLRGKQQHRQLEQKVDRIYLHILLT